MSRNFPSLPVCSASCCTLESAGAGKIAGAALPRSASAPSSDWNSGGVYESSGMPFAPVASGARASTVSLQSCPALSPL